MAFIPKAPSANDRDINLIIPKAKDPYLVEWFQDTRQTGESVNQFIIRALMQHAKKHQIDKQVQEKLKLMQTEGLSLDTNLDFIIKD